MRGHREAQAYYGIVKETMDRYLRDGTAETRELSAKVALDIERIVDERKIRDWASNEDAVKRMEDAIDDYLFEAPAQYGVKLETGDIDTILHGSLGIAKKLAGR